MRNIEVFVWMAFVCVFLALVCSLNLFSAEPSITFVATGNPGFLQIQGHIPAEDIETDCKTATVNLSNLKTGIALRDKHATEKYLQTGLEQNRFAKLDLQTSQLTLHGVTRKVELKTVAKYPPTGKWEFDIKLSDFGVEIPSFMGVTVADSVHIEAECHK